MSTLNCEQNMVLINLLGIFIIMVTLFFL
jgi:hypothetical protein